MGSAEDDPDAFPHELPRHPVDLTPFLIAKYEVSQQQFQLTQGSKHFVHGVGDHLPAHGLSWLEAAKFCDDAGLSLPTEAQWEYACRGGTTTPFHCGARLTAEAANHDRLYYSALRGSSRPTVLPVTSFEPNAFGLHNMHGNVAEWCQDTFAADFYSRPQATVRNPLCTDGSDSRVVRGGSFLSIPEECRSASRNPLPFSTADSAVGVRPVFHLW